MISVLNREMYEQHIDSVGRDMSCIKTMTSSQEDAEKLEYAARLSGLLLNEATDVMRWFLYDNLPRTASGKPEIEKLLEKHQKTFKSLRDDADFKSCYFGHEMFDILYPPDAKMIDRENMEISLLFTLIRYMCGIRHPTWVWWSEQPQPHQTAPIFDIIRLVNFKEKMKKVVHNYEITKKSYEKSVNYITDVIERLRGYKRSARRWQDDVISYGDEEPITKERKAIDLVTIMRWQTLPIKKRNALYLVLKQNFYDKVQNYLDVGVAWINFISYFGQMKNLNICKINEIQHDVSSTSDNDSKNRSESFESPAEVLNWHLVHDIHWKDMLKGTAKIVSHEKSAKSNGTTKEESNLKQFEKNIYSSVDDKVFITDLEQNSKIVALLRANWRSMAITTFSKISAFPFKKENEINMDDVVIRVSRNNDIGRESLPNWTEMFESENMENKAPFRTLIRGYPQYGKTTILQKIAYDCATKNFPQLQAFDLVFYMDLSKITYDKPYTRMADCIKRHSLEYGCEISSDEIESVIYARSGARVLFLLDDVDSIVPSEEMSEVIDVIKAKQWPMCSVIATANEFDFDEEYTRSSKRELLSGSQLLWQHYCASGFNYYDIVKRVRNVIGGNDKSRDSIAISTSRHFINLLRVFQRDFYTTESSPLLVSILCEAWKLKTGNKFQNIMSETLGDMLNVLTKSYDVEILESDQQSFNAAVLEATFSNTRKRPEFQTEDEENIKALLESGVLLIAARKENIISVYFACQLLQDFFAARVYCQKYSAKTIKSQIKNIADAIRSRHFLMFCCERSDKCAEDILEVLSDMALEHQKIDSICEQEDGEARNALIELCLHCFHVSSLSYRSRGYQRLTLALHDTATTSSSLVDSFDEINNSGLIVADLALSQPNKLSSKTKQSLLKFTSVCSPLRTNSGTVFPLLCTEYGVPSSSYIRKLSISKVAKDQIAFVVAIITRLQFLDSILLTDIEDITKKDFKALCTSLKPIRPCTASPLNSLTITFKNETKFDLVNIPTFEDLSYVLRHLPFLETLILQPVTFKSFASLYMSESIVPIKHVDLSCSNISETQCLKLIELLSLSFFVNSLNLSRNPIYNGLTGCCKTFRNFRSLKIINLEQGCLSPSSLTAFASCFTESRLTCSLTSLNLRANHIDDQMALLNFVKSVGKLRALSELDLSQNFLRDYVICVLAGQFCNFPRLRVLRLDYVQMKEVGFSAVRSNLAYLEKLEIFSVGENSLSSECLNIIPYLEESKAPALSQLVELTLTGLSEELPLKISEGSLKNAASSLKSLKNIKILDLSNIDMKYSEVITILKAAEDHPTITTIRLSDRLTSLNSAERNTWKCLQLT